MLDLLIYLCHFCGLVVLLAPCQWGALPDSHAYKLIPSYSMMTVVNRQKKRQRLPACVPAKFKLKADRPHPRNYPHTPTDHRHTDKHFRLVMTLLCSKLAVLLFAALGKAEPLISTAARKKFDLDLLP